MNLRSGILYVCFLMLFGFMSTVVADIKQDTFLSVSLNYDIGIETDPDLIETVLVNDSDGDSLSDLRWTLNADYSITPIIVGYNEVGFNISGQANYYDKNIDNKNLNLSSFYKRNEMGNFDFYCNYTYSHHEIDNKAYVYYNTISPVLFWRQKETLTGMFLFRFRDINYYEVVNADILNGMDMGFLGKEIIQINEKNRFAAGLYINSASLEEEYASYSGMALVLEYNVKLLERIEFEGIMRIGQKTFNDDDPIEFEIRKDSYLTFLLGMDYDFGVSGKVFAGLLFTDNSSNIERFDERTRTAISAGYSIKF